jgi:two-component system, NarL family, sensor histidine kinase DesK
MAQEQESSVAPMKTIHVQLGRSYMWWEDHLIKLRESSPLVVASGISLRLWRLYAQAWLICLLFPLLTLIQQPPPPPQLLLALAGLAVFVIAYTRIMWSHPLHTSARDRWPLRASVLLLTGLTALVLVLSLTYGSAFLWLLIGVSAMAGVMLPARSAFLAVMLLTLLTFGSSVGIAGGIGAADWLHIVPLVLLVRGLGLDMAGLARLASALREVHAARGELARMAVVEERLRMARDLHDLLGQSLSMITLKSELAARLVGHDPAQAAQEMRAVEQAARHALREVRATVAGYRQPTLQSELDGARQLLAAAGIDYTIEQMTEALPAAVDAVLAWTVREGVTNVVRHSRAACCRIRIATAPGSVTTEVINDRICAHEAHDTPARMGSGLAGLTDRVTAQGGQLVAGSLDNDKGFRLWVQLPIGSSTTGQEYRS